MLLLLSVGFLGGVITGLSPCVVPVLPVVVAGGSTGTDRRRPYAVIAGLVVSFVTFTLVGGALLRLLDLPQDVLEYLGIALLLALSVGLLVPWLGEQLERPFARLGAGRVAGTPGGTGIVSGFALGIGLGLVFVPCAGPVLATISVVVANHHIGSTAVLLTSAYTLGVATPLLVVALVVQRTALGWSALRRRLPTVRRIAGALVGVAALAILFNLTGPLTAVPGYTSALEAHIEGGTGIAGQLRALDGEHPNTFASRQSVASARLPDLGHAPTFVGITHWINTPGGSPLDLSALRGHVVLVDFWTYSCINCQRELPHVESWYRTYRSDGLVVVGVHTPEFPFEHVVSNVEAAVHRLGVRFPVAVDDTYKTWDAYANQYWPAEYLIDQNGVVRHTQFGEGGYHTTQTDIRALLSAGGVRHLPPATDTPDHTPTQMLTTETYLGYIRFDLARYVGSSAIPGKQVRYRLAPQVPAGDVSLGGTWTQHPWDVTAGSHAVIELSFVAADVYLVLGGSGTVSVSVNGRPAGVVHVSGIPDLHTMVAFGHETSGLLTLRLSSGLQAYDFTFG
ncbi:MAG: cytochrome c biogenesis protein DipZ [Acidimicrobiales bacterium]